MLRPAGPLADRARDMESPEQKKAFANKLTFFPQASQGPNSCGALCLDMPKLGLAGLRVKGYGKTPVAAMRCGWVWMERCSAEC